MRNYLTALLLSVILILAGCSNSSEEHKSGEPKDKKRGSETISYTTDDGKEIEIPKDPQRIVVMGAGYFGNFKQLGANIVGVHHSVEDSEVLKEQIGDIELIEDDNLEQVVNLEPDLIVTYDTDENLEDLKQIAPTIPMEYEKWNYLDVHKEFGKIVGEEDKANQWVEDFESQLENDKKKIREHIDSDDTVTVMEEFAKDIYVYGSNWGRGTEIIYQGLGLDMPENVKNDVEQDGWKKISAEEVNTYSGDYIFLGQSVGATDSALKDSNVWKSLKAVKNNHVYEFDSESFWFNDPYSLEYQKDYIVEQLTK